MDDFPRGGREIVIQDQEIVVCVQRHLVGKEGSRCLSWRKRELLGKGAGRGEECAGKRKTVYKAATIQKRSVFHVIIQTFQEGKVKCVRNFFYFLNGSLRHRAIA